jgi:hypothetical protein
MSRLHPAEYFLLTPLFSSLIVFVGKILKIFSGKLELSFEQMSRSVRTTDREVTALFSLPPLKTQAEQLTCSTGITGKPVLSKFGQIG